MKKSTYILNACFTLAASFFATMFISDWFLRDARVFPFALLSAFFVTYFVCRKDRQKMRRARTKNTEALLNKFVFSPAAYAIDFTCDALKIKGTPIERDGLLSVGGTAFYPCFLPEKLHAVSIAEGFARAAKVGAKRLIFLTAYGATPDAESLAARLQTPQTTVWDFDKTYAFYCYLKHPPTETLALGTEKKRFVFKEAIDRRRAIKYVFTAIVLLFFARLTPFAPLYAVTAAICLTLALVCLFASRTPARRKKHKKHD